ncbi:MAG: hypothetical protein RIS51_605, partial [Actinomycetota bacterium]
MAIKNSLKNLFTKTGQTVATESEKVAEEVTKMAEEITSEALKSVEAVAKDVA